MKTRARAVALALVLALILPPAIAAGACIFGGKTEEAPWEWTAPEDCVVCRVEIKTGLTGTIPFTENGSDGCYAVAGIGSATASAEQVGEPGPGCQDISNVSWYIDCRPTSISMLSLTTPGRVGTLIVSLLLVALIAFAANDILRQVLIEE